MWTVYVCRSRSTQMPVRVKDFYEADHDDFYSHVRSPYFSVQQFDAQTMMPLVRVVLPYDGEMSKAAVRQLIFADLDIEEEYKDC